MLRQRKPSFSGGNVPSVAPRGLYMLTLTRFWTGETTAIIPRVAVTTLKKQSKKVTCKVLHNGCHDAKYLFHLDFLRNYTIEIKETYISEMSERRRRIQLMTSLFEFLENTEVVY
uniref:Uncharacterized protein n=1 Tax=Cacopsylla melanoneura TaxID=428564 RepID=A0A8D8LMZ7_9HEMI